jgi:hypothetical protein
MLEKIVTIGSILGIGFAALLWVQATFVAAADWSEYQYRQANEEVLYLQDKQKRLEKEQKELEFEDSRKLQRGIEEREYWKNQIEK